VTVKPTEPAGNSSAWYRGWEISFDDQAAAWVGEGWRAYKGGCDIGASQLSAQTFNLIVTAIDDEEDDA